MSLKIISETIKKILLKKFHKDRNEMLRPAVIKPYANFVLTEKIRRHKEISRLGLFF